MSKNIKHIKLSSLLKLDKSIYHLRNFFTPILVENGKIPIFSPIKVIVKAKELKEIDTKVGIDIKVLNYFVPEKEELQKLVNNNYLFFTVDNELFKKGFLLQSQQVLFFDDEETFKILLFNYTDKEIEIKQGEYLGFFLLHRSYKKFTKKIATGMNGVHESKYQIK